MPKYLIEASYVGEGIAGLRKDGGSGRRNAVEEATRAAGGQLEAIYFAFGETDVFIIIDLPGNVNAAGLSLLVASSGLVKPKTVVLLTPEEMDAAVNVEGAYRRPGA
ncbi:MAG TPA: GYD domain-containing protein [Acidimicrobiales bacterium]|nr:GYD domain-containing protein [Acidimicrobiales bacterium]